MDIRNFALIGATNLAFGQSDPRVQPLSIHTDRPHVFTTKPLTKRQRRRLRRRA